jgi:hypothetical protein
MNRRRFLAFLAAALSIPVFGRAFAAPPADFCLKHPNHPKCRPSPTPTPSPTPSPSPSPPPTGIVYGPHAGAQYVRDHAGPLPVI